MRYRKLTSNGDYSFGQSAANFFVDEVQAVSQSVLTRLRLWEGEWFLDKNEGTPWIQSVLGVRTNPTYDLAIQARILTTTGVQKIVSYTSALNRESRRLSVTVTIMTIFSTQPVTLEVNL